MGKRCIEAGSFVGVEAVVTAGVPGNEEGYVVKMTDGDPSPPYLVVPGTRVRLVSDYSAAERRLGERYAIVIPLNLLGSMQ